MPIRNVSNHGKNITGAIPSRKLGRMVHFESLTERAYYYLLPTRCATSSQDLAQKHWGLTHHQSRWSSRQEWPPAQSHLACERMDSS